MTKTGNGVKAGAVAGIVYGIIASIFSIVGLVLFKTQVLATLTKYADLASSRSGVTISAQAIYNLEFILSPIVSIIGGIILGLILGLIFAYVYHRLPGSKATTKGMIFGLILWIILGLLLGIGNISEFSLSYYVLTSVVGGFIATIAYGFLMGSLFDRWEKSEAPVSQEPAYPKL